MFSAISKSQEVKKKNTSLWCYGDSAASYSSDIRKFAKITLTLLLDILIQWKWHAKHYHKNCDSSHSCNFGKKKKIIALWFFFPLHIIQPWLYSEKTHFFYAFVVEKMTISLFRCWTVSIKSFQKSHYKGSDTFLNHLCSAVSKQAACAQ